METSQLPRNTVVAYQGGGYDGCIWEWNYAFVDGEGNFHDILSSGWFGIRSAEGLLKSLRCDSQTETYDMTDEGDRHRLADTEPAPKALKIAAWFASRKELGVELTLKCDRCGDRSPPQGCRLDGFHGCGGCHITADDIICPTCYEDHTCWRCGEYTSGELVDKIARKGGTEVELTGRVCHWCAEQLLTTTGTGDKRE